jgi:hypothetical protein
MEISLQRLGDDPRDFDGNFTGIQQGHADVSGLRADADPFSSEKPLEPASEGKPEFGRWNIYPSPPPAHWHWQGKTPDGKHVVGEGGEGFDESRRDTQGDVKLVPVDNFKEEKEKSRGTNGSEGFDMKDATVPGKDSRNWSFAVDSEGVYQVYETPGTFLHLPRDQYSFELTNISNSRQCRDPDRRQTPLQKHLAEGILQGPRLGSCCLQRRARKEFRIPTLEVSCQ